LPVEVDRAGLIVQAADLIPRPAVIYTTTVDDAEALYSRLQARGYRRIELFTGDTDDAAERQRVIDSWSLGATDLVIATSAFGMGVDKPNVRAIVHACLPEGADRFYQEIGRGGRDGHQALSLCLWTDGDASIAANLAIHGWMAPDTSISRWKAILEEGRAKGYFSHGPQGTLRLKVPLDARRETLGRITGRLNRQWNAALLTLLQRSGALRIVSEEHTASGAELWVAEIMHPEIVDDSSSGLLPYLSLGESEARSARAKAAALERGLRNDEEGCYRTVLFDMVEPSGSPWPCGRCPVCVAAGEHPHGRSDRHEFTSPWPDQPWNRRAAFDAGAWVINTDEFVLLPALDRLVTRLATIGIEQFVTTSDMLEAVEQSVCSATLDLGFTLLLGGDVTPCRVPTAVLIDSAAQASDTVRMHCLALRRRFEAWRELPLLFVLPQHLGGVAAFQQHLSPHAPISGHELSRIGSSA
jgi:ATP-dependent DNA helicase RecQ